MKTLLIYDDAGYVISNIAGDYRIPVGIPYLEVEIPVGKRIKSLGGIGVDVSVTPHQAILEDIPPTEIEELRTQLKNTNDTLDFLLLG